MHAASEAGAAGAAVAEQLVVGAEAGAAMAGDVVVVDATLAEEVVGSVEVVAAGADSAAETTVVVGKPVVETAELRERAVAMDQQRPAVTKQTEAVHLVPEAVAAGEGS